MALATAFDLTDGKTVLTLGRRSRGDPLDDIDKDVRRAVARQLFIHITGGGNRKAAILDVGKQLGISVRTVEALLEDYVENARGKQSHVARVEELLQIIDHLLQ